MYRLLPIAFLFAASCGNGPALTDSEEARRDNILELPGNMTSGEALFQALCSDCHGEDLEGGTGPALNVSIKEEVIIANILAGNGLMTAFGGQLDDQQIADVTAFVYDAGQP